MSSSAQADDPVFAIAAVNTGCCSRSGRASCCLHTRKDLDGRRGPRTVVTASAACQNGYSLDTTMLSIEARSPTERTHAAKASSKCDNSACRPRYRSQRVCRCDMKLFPRGNGTIPGARKCAPGTSRVRGNAAGFKCAGCVSRPISAIRPGFRPSIGPSYHGTMACKIARRRRFGTLFTVSSPSR